MRKALVLIGLIATSSTAGADPLSGQSDRRLDFAQGSHWWVGYVANAPKQLAGAGTAVLVPRLGGIGLYADIKITTDSPARETFRKDLTPEDAEAFGDTEFEQQGAWTNVNAAVVKVLGSEFAVYAGVGLGMRTMYRNFTDETRTRSDTGMYWVKDEPQSGAFPNGMGGAFFRLGNRVVFQFGAETAPAGFTAGMHLALW